MAKIIHLFVWLQALSTLESCHQILIEEFTGKYITYLHKVWWYRSIYFDFTIRYIC